MRVLFASTLEGHWAGSEWLWAETARQLARRGHAVGFCQPWVKDHPAICALRLAGAAEFAEHRPARWHRRLRQRLFDRRPFPARTVAAFAPDMVVISQARHDEGSAWHSILAEAKVPYVVLNHSVVDNLYLEDALADKLAAFFLAARRVYFVSERSRRLAETQLGWRLPEARLAQNPFRVPHDAPFAWPGETALRIALVARLDPATKGHDVILEVLARPHWQDRPLWLHFFGEGSAERRLRRLTEMWGVKNVVFEGFTDQIPAIWERCQVVGVPSRQEALPISMIEGMLMGRPVFGTAVGGIPEIVEEGVSGFLAPACVADLLDAALQRLWDQRDRLPEMGKAAQARARQCICADPAAAFADELLTVVGPV